MMDAQQIALVRANFALVAPVSKEAAALFYGRLFEIAPPLRALFRGDMQSQGAKLMAMLATAVVIRCSLARCRMRRAACLGLERRLVPCFFQKRLKNLHQPSTRRWRGDITPAA